MLREFLRQRRKARRIAKDDTQDQLLSDEDDKVDYWANLEIECGESSLIHLFEQALENPGDMVECGVYRGASLRRIAKVAKDKAPDRTIYGLDSFEGFPEGGITDHDTQMFRSETRLMGKFKDADDVPARLEKFAQVFDINLDLRKGYFENTLPDLVGLRIAFLHLDCDTYAGHKEVLEALFPQIVPGGIVVFDDYNDPAWPGSTQAVDEFLSDRAEIVEQSTARTNPAWFVRKST